MKWGSDFGDSRGTMQSNKFVCTINEPRYSGIEQASGSEMLTVQRAVMVYRVDWCDWCAGKLSSRCRNRVIVCGTRRASTCIRKYMNTPKSWPIECRSNWRLVFNFNRDFFDATRLDTTRPDPTRLKSDVKVTSTESGRDGWDGVTIGWPWRRRVGHVWNHQRRDVNSADLTTDDIQ